VTSKHKIFKIIKVYL